VSRLKDVGASKTSPQDRCYRGPAALVVAPSSLQHDPAVGKVRRGVCPCRPLSALQPSHRTELAHQTAGRTDPANAGASALPIGQVESCPIATAAFSRHSRFGHMVGSSQLASAEDARDARRDPLWPELATDLLRWRSAGVLAMQIALSLGGITAMIVSATLLDLISIKPRQRSAETAHS